MRPAALLLISFFVMTFVTHAEEKPLKVFVLAGQSNMVGKRCKAAKLPADLQKEQPSALFFKSGKWVRLKPGVSEKKGFGPEIAFASRMAESMGEPIGIIKLSKGGTSLAEKWDPKRKQSLYNKLRALVNEAAASRKIEIVGMLWMQGGADAKNPAKAKAYAANLKAFIEKARADFKSANMAFVCGRSAAPVKKYPNIAHVRKGQEGIALPAYAWVDHDNIHMGSDGVHYSTKGQVDAGNGFADAMIKLLKK